MMTRLTVNGRNYNVEVTGQGIPLVLLHGFTGDTTIWDDLRPHFEQSHHVIAIDILGHGQSDKPDDVSAYQMENAACDILKLIEVLSVGKVHLLGYSMGGRLALYLATQFPERFHSLILESASPGLATPAERAERRNRDNALADKIEANGIEWFVDFWERLPLWSSQKNYLILKQREQRLRNSPVGLANSLRGMGTGVQPNLWDDVHNLMMPVQLIVGERDEKYVHINREMFNRILDVELNIISNVGHNVHLENLAMFVETVKDFLKQ